MKANVGGIDRVVRLLAGLALIALGVFGTLLAPWNMVAIGAGAVFTLTSVFRFCPLYTVLGIHSCPLK
jgi:hypothetical protein